MGHCASTGVCQHHRLRDARHHLSTLRALALWLGSFAQALMARAGASGWANRMQRQGLRDTAKGSHTHLRSMAVRMEDKRFQVQVGKQAGGAHGGISSPRPHSLGNVRIAQRSCQKQVAGGVASRLSFGPTSAADKSQGRSRSVCPHYPQCPPISPVFLRKLPWKHGLRNFRSETSDACCRPQAPHRPFLRRKACDQTGDREGAAAALEACLVADPQHIAAKHLLAAMGQVPLLCLECHPSAAPATPHSTTHALSTPATFPSERSHCLRGIPAPLAPVSCPPYH